MGGNKSATTATHYNVAGMTCKGCSMKLTKTLSALEGVKVNMVDHRSGAIELSLNGKTTAQQVETAITKAGYRILPANKS